MVGLSFPFSATIADSLVRLFVVVRRLSSVSSEWSTDSSYNLIGGSDSSPYLVLVCDQVGLVQEAVFGKLVLDMACSWWSLT